MIRFFGVLSTRIMRTLTALHSCPPRRNGSLGGCYRGLPRGSFAVAVGSLFLALATPNPSFAAEDGFSTLGLTVSGKDIVNGTGQKVYIHGFNSFGTAQKCTDGFSHVLPNGRSYNRSFTYFERLKLQWNVNAFRIMINEKCWKDNIVYNGVTHRNAIKEVVDALVANNMIPIITLAAVRDHPSAAPTVKYGDVTMAMPNLTHSESVWQTLAAMFKATSATDAYSRIIFDAYNEPTPYLCQNITSVNYCQSGGAYCNGNTTNFCTGRPFCNLMLFQFDAVKAQTCIRDGGAACAVTNLGVSNENPQCMIPGPGANSLGVQRIVDIIRNPPISATNVILVPGFNYSGDLSKWDAFKPVDPLNKLAASKHNYSFGPTAFGDACDPDFGGSQGSSIAGCKTRLERGLTANGNGVTFVNAPVVFGEYGTQWESPTESPYTGGDQGTDEPNAINCQNTEFIPFLIDYAKEKKYGHMFHDAWALRLPNIGLPGNPNRNPLAPNRPCQNFQSFKDYGEGAPQAGEGIIQPDGVFDNGGNIIEPTVYGKQFKDRTMNDSWTYGGSSSDTTPDSFSFTGVNNVALGSPQVSNLVTITGINAAAAISVSSGSSYSINGGSFVTTAGTISNSDTVRVAHFAASIGSTTVTTTLTIGGVIGTFISTTISADTTPDAFSFTPVSNADTNFAQASPNQITVSGINAATPISISAGSTYQIGTGPYVGTPGSIMNGQMVRVAHFTSAAHSTTVITTLTIGGVSGTFSSTTRAPGTYITPNAFSFTPTTNVPVNSTQVSNFTTITGIDGNAPISVSSGSSYEINFSGNFVTTPGTITNNSNVRVAHFAASTASTTKTTTLNIGGVTGTFTSTTAP